MSRTATDGESPLAPYLRAVRTHWVVVLLTLLTTVGASVLWLSVRAREYEAVSTLLVTPLPQDDQLYLGLPLLRDSGDPTRTVQTAASLVDTRASAAEAARRLGRGFTTDRIIREVDVLPEGQSNLLNVVARAETPELAAEVANRFVDAVVVARRNELRILVEPIIAAARAQLAATSGDAAVTLAERLNALERVRDGRDPTVSIAERAAPPASAVGAPAALVVALALLAGLALGTGAALLVSLLSPRRIADEREFARVYPVPVLTTVPEVPRRDLRGRGFAAQVALPPLVREAYRTLELQLELRHDGARSILFTSASAGDGKTSSVASLAFELTAAGNRVVLLDLDLRKPDLAHRLAVDELPPHPAEALAAGRPLRDLLVPVSPAPSMRLFAPGEDAPRDLEEAIVNRWPAVLEEALALADYVLIDTPPLGEVSDALRYVPVVDEVVVVARVGHTGEGNLEQVRDLLRRAGSEASGAVLIGGPQRNVAYGNGYSYTEYTPPPTRA